MRKTKSLDVPQISGKVTGIQVRQNSVMKERATLKLLLKIVIKEGISGVQKDSTKAQKSSSLGADWKNHVVGQVTMI